MKRVHPVAVFILSILSVGVLLTDVHLREHRDITQGQLSAAKISKPTLDSAFAALDLDRIERLLNSSVWVNSEQDEIKARVALYRGDCDRALALLQPQSSVAGNERELLQVAGGCARAMSAARVIVDENINLWIRVQDDADADWVPLLARVAAQARDFAAAQLGISRQLPLRIELVMDHLSLAALSGLPLKAVETTSTVAVARWGRVTMMSPRLFPAGYPWQDTLAHEIVHLLVSAASDDHAPLWLQEALAKHLEERWRPPRPLDATPNPHEVVRNAWQRGQLVGVEHLGPSMALLPSSESASIAYAEVADLLDHIIHRCGWAAIRLLLRDLKALGRDGSDAALRSATGYTLAEWTLLSRDLLMAESRAAPKAIPNIDEQQMHRLRWLRLGELLLNSQQPIAASEYLAAVTEQPPRDPWSSALLGLTQFEQGLPQRALHLMGPVDELPALNSEWLALKGRGLVDTGDIFAAHQYFDWAMAIAPTHERIQCEGYARSEWSHWGADMNLWDPLRKTLCLATRAAQVPAQQP